MDKHDLTQLARRSFLCRGAGVISGLLATGGLDTALANQDVSGGKSFEDRFNAAFSNEDVMSIKQFMVALLTEPDLPILASDFLQANLGSLTSFQVSLLQAVGIMTRDPGVLSALLLGKGLLPIQNTSLASITKELGKNLAIRKLLTRAERLKRYQQSTQLRNYVFKAVSALSQTLPAEMPLGSAPFDAVTNEVYDMMSSMAYKNITGALIPLMGDPDFLPFLKNQPPQILLSIIPADVQIALRLPTDRDPPLTDTQKGVLEVVGTVSAALLAALTAPLTVPVVALILVGEATGCIIGYDDIAKGLQVGLDP